MVCGFIRWDRQEKKVHCNLYAKCSTNIRPLDWWRDTSEFLAQRLAQKNSEKVLTNRGAPSCWAILPPAGSQETCSASGLSGALGGSLGKIRGELGKRRKPKVPDPKGFSFSPEGSTLRSKRAGLLSVLLTFTAFAYAAPLHHQGGAHPNPKSLFRAAQILPPPEGHPGACQPDSLIPFFFFFFILTCTERTVCIWLYAICSFLQISVLWYNFLVFSMFPTVSRA